MFQLEWEYFVLSAFCVLGSIEFIKKGLGCCLPCVDCKKYRPLFWFSNLVLSVLFGYLIHFRTEVHEVVINSVAILSMTQIGYDTFFTAIKNKILRNQDRPHKEEDKDKKPKGISFGRQ